MGNFTIFRCSKILGEAGKQELLQKIVVWCPCLVDKDNHILCFLTSAPHLEQHTKFFIIKHN